MNGQGLAQLSTGKHGDKHPLDLNLQSDPAKEKHGTSEHQCFPGLAQWPHSTPMLSHKCCHAKSSLTDIDSKQKTIVVSKHEPINTPPHMSCFN